jgi:hypothetical protein
VARDVFRPSRKTHNKAQSPDDAPPPLWINRQASAGAVGHPNCEIEPYAQGIAMIWRTGWLSCDDWKEKIAFNCASGENGIQVSGVRLDGEPIQ